MFGKSIDKAERTFYYIKCEIQKEKVEHHSAGTLARLPLITLFIELLFMSVLEYAHSYNTYKLAFCQLNSGNSAHFHVI
jgi:hypothetical protein